MFGAVGLRTHIWNNSWKSALLLAGFPLLLALLGFGVALMLAAGHVRGFQAGVVAAIGDLPWILALAMVAAAAWYGIAWRFSNALLDWASGAHPVTRQQEPRLWNALETLCIARGLPMPRLAVIESEALNAFAAGLRRRDASVTVTRGLLAALDGRELAAVLAHELTHIRNGDARLGLIAAIFAGIIGIIAEMMLRGTGRVGWRSSDRRDGGNVALLLMGLVLVAMAWGLAVLLRMALSRNREFLADAGAVELTQDADAMIGALRKVAGHSELPGVPRQVRALFLDDGQGSIGNRLMATHPPIDARIAALVRYAGGRDPGPPTRAVRDLPERPWDSAQPAPPATGGANPWQG